MTHKDVFRYAKSELNMENNPCKKWALIQYSALDIFAWVQMNNKWNRGI